MDIQYRINYKSDMYNALKSDEMLKDIDERIAVLGEMDSTIESLESDLSLALSKLEEKRKAANVEYKNLSRDISDAKDTLKSTITSVSYNNTQYSVNGDIIKMQKNKIANLTKRRENLLRFLQGLDDMIDKVLSELANLSSISTQISHISMSISTQKDLAKLKLSRLADSSRYSAVFIERYIDTEIGAGHGFEPVSYIRAKE